MNAYLVYLNNGYSQTDAAEPDRDTFQKGDEVVNAAIMVEVGVVRGAGDRRTVLDLLASATGLGDGYAVGFPVIGAVDAAAFQLWTKMEMVEIKIYILRYAWKPIICGIVVYTDKNELIPND